MVIIVKGQAKDKEVKELISELEKKNISIQITQGIEKTILGLVGDTTKVDIDEIRSKNIVEDVKRISEPYKKANRKFHNEDTVVDINGQKIGGGNFSIIAGPCSVESETQVCDIAKNVKKAGAQFLRGGAFKPRTSPYAFQGLKAEGIDFLCEAKAITGMPIVTEIMSIDHLPLFENVDIIQVGARNMQNFEMLKELGKTNKPILLKRGLANTIEELLMSAEYILSGGNDKVILCERGIRTFETATRNTLDISAIPVLKAATHLPIIVDPSHSAGLSELVLPLALAAVAVGADGLMIEVHNDPKNALCDGRQSLNYVQFDELVRKVDALKQCVKML